MADSPLSPIEVAEQPLALQTLLHSLRRMHVENVGLRQSRRLTLNRARTPEHAQRAHEEIAYTVAFEYELNQIIAAVEKRQAEITNQSA